MDEEYRFDVFGRLVLVRKTSNSWIALYVGHKGKSRPAEDIRIPSNVPAKKLGEFLADLCHEWATPERPEVRPLS